MPTPDPPVGSLVPRPHLAHARRGSNPWACSRSVERSMKSQCDVYWKREQVLHTAQSDVHYPNL